MSQDIEVMLSAILGGSRPALARAASLIENRRRGAGELATRLRGHCGKAHVVGVTGAPGAGKSTLINALIGEWLARGKRVAVVAVDPSSPVSGGAVLGDRVRMAEHALHDDVFIRSVSARGHLGGVSRATAQIVDLFDAAGFDVVIVETVGTGQSEVEIARVADTKIVVCPPGLGDDVQAIKAGILEIADILVVNKADHPQAERTMLDLEVMLHLRAPSAWRVPVLRTTATSGQGVAALADSIAEHGRAAGTGLRSRQAVHDVAQDTEGAGPKEARRMSDLDDLLLQTRQWREQGRGVALATVVRTWGSSPRPEGSHLAVSDTGAFVGSVSGGCVEAAVVDEAQTVIRDGRPKLLEYGVSDEQAWAVGLACGGRVQVYVERVE